MLYWIIPVAVTVILVFFVVGIYNGLVRRRKEVDNAWAQIDVQLKRRCDLIPNLLETVKGYAAHEAGVLEKVTQARSAAMAARGTTEKIAAETSLGGALRSLMVQVEAYPELKANQNFLALQEELTSTENRIGFARQHYNDSATNYNTAIALFPAVIFAGMFGFRAAELWQITDAAEREVPKIKF
jgi:LemA protein